MRHNKSTPVQPSGEAVLTRQMLRTPRAAGVAGVVFSVLLGVALALVNLASPSDPTQVGNWVDETARRDAVLVALNLVPFAGMAFLWFIGVVRDRIGQREDRFFATVFLGSGVLFVAMLFVASTLAGGLIGDSELRSSDSSNAAVLSLGHRVTGLLLNTYGMRMAAVFTLSAAMIIFRTETLPRWLAITGFGVGLVLFVSIGMTPWVELLFPGWILLVSIDILRAGLRAPRRTGTSPTPPTS